MKRLSLSSSQVNTITTVSNSFIDNFMMDANGEFVKVYIYLLRHLSSSDISMGDIADRLNLTEKDVVRALKYWDQKSVLSVTFKGNEPESITILELDSVSQTSKETVATLSEINTEETVNTDINTDTEASDVSHPDKNAYSPAQIKRLKEQEDIRELLFIVEQYIGKTLSGTDVNTVIYIHNGLGFSPDLVEYLVEYCVTNNHTSLRYIEKVALAWHSQGITNINDAKEAAAIRSKRTIAVTRAFGISDRNLTPIELDFINRWYDDYGFDPVIVEEACKRTILTMSKPNFSYTDGILRKWKTNNLHTLEDLKNFDAGYRAKITVPAGNKTNVAKSTNNFNNFSQRTYNFDEIEKTLISNNK